MRLRGYLGIIWISRDLGWGSNTKNTDLKTTSRRCGGMKTPSRISIGTRK
ncbi:unnamed protein product [Meloidogyne enterolobii]|uniref:Uncharacterized protein n=1 Tax=Meloidogyne enterolobii TaxID=390850 RepID=A0ACB0YGF4_MELEN